MADVTLDDLADVVHPAQPVPGHRGPAADETTGPTPTTPRRGRPPKTPSQPIPNVATGSKTEVPQLPKGAVRDAVSQLHVFGGMGLNALGKPETGGTLIKEADAIGEAWEELAKTNPAVRRAMISLMMTSAWGGLAVAYMPVAVALVNEKPKPKDPAGEPPVSRGFKNKAAEQAATPAAATPAYVPVRERPPVSLGADF
jgi:hypothetical protein